MCPSNKRAAGAHNPDYRTTFVFDNDYPALLPDTPIADMDLDGLLVAKGEAGICRVLCFSPRHDLTISGMEVTDLRLVVDAWHNSGRIWASVFSINGPPIVSLTPSGTCTLNFIGLCFALRRCADSWLAMKCSLRRSET